MDGQWQSYNPKHMSTIEQKKFLGSFHDNIGWTQVPFQLSLGHGPITQSWVDIVSKVYGQSPGACWLGHDESKLIPSLFNISKPLSPLNCKNGMRIPCKSSIGILAKWDVRTFWPANSFFNPVTESFFQYSVDEKWVMECRAISWPWRWSLWTFKFKIWASGYDFCAPIFLPNYSPCTHGKCSKWQLQDTRLDWHDSGMLFDNIRCSEMLQRRRK